MFHDRSLERWQTLELFNDLAAELAPKEIIVCVRGVRSLVRPRGLVEHQSKRQPNRHFGKGRAFVAGNGWSVTLQGTKPIGLCSASTRILRSALAALRHSICDPAENASLGEARKGGPK